MAVRLFICLQLIFAVFILPKRATFTRLMVRCLCGVLGLVVRQENLHKNPLYEDEEEVQAAAEGDEGTPDKRLVVIANHVSPFDHFALSLVMPCIKLSCNGEDIPWPLSSLLGVELFDMQGSAHHTQSVMGSVPPAQTVRKDEAFIAKLKAFLGTPSTTSQATPLLLFPEDTTTNGTAALLQYQVWCSSVAGSKPSVACIRVQRVPPLPLRAAGVINSTFTQHLLTLFFCPITTFTVRYLGRVPRLADEEDEHFSKRLQTLTAEALGLQTTNYDALEKVEYVKRCMAAHESRWPPVSAGSEGLHRPDLVALASQVQEVLPHLPLTAILRDVARTGNVDITITNFLEGSVPDYTGNAATEGGGGGGGPLSSPMGGGPLESPPPPPTAPNSPINLSTKASSFPNSASDRMYSFQDRKNFLIENALRKYIEKFGLHGEEDPYLHQPAKS